MSVPTVRFYDSRVPIDEALDALAQALVTDHPSAQGAPQLLRRWAAELRGPDVSDAALSALARITGKVPA